jgi:large subunit ribosomal protein L20
MTRVRRGFKARQRRNKILKLAKGYHFDRRTKYRHASHTVKRALHNAYKMRRLFKREIRKLWIVRINAAVRELGASYSTFIHALSQKGIALNRKVLSEMAIKDPAGFRAVFESLALKR